MTAADDVKTHTPLLLPECRALGQHWLVCANVARCGCASLDPRPQHDDDRGDTLVKQSGGLRRDRWNRIIA